MDLESSIMKLPTTTSILGLTGYLKAAPITYGTTSSLPADEFREHCSPAIAGEMA